MYNFSTKTKISVHYKYNIMNIYICILRNERSNKFTNFGAP